VNRALPFLHGGLLEKKLTASLSDDEGRPGGFR